MFGKTFSVLHYRLQDWVLQYSQEKAAEYILMTFNFTLESQNAQSVDACDPMLNGTKLEGSIQHPLLSGFFFFMSKCARKGGAYHIESTEHSLDLFFAVHIGRRQRYTVPRKATFSVL